MGFDFEVSAVTTDPMCRPPHFEPENAHEVDVLQFSDGCHVVASRLGGFEAEEAAWGGGGGGGGSDGDVFGDIGEDDVAVDL